MDDLEFIMNIFLDLDEKDQSRVIIEAENILKGGYEDEKTERNTI